MQTLLKRSLTGIIYVALVVCSILFTNWAFPALCALFVLLGLIEFDKLTRDIGTISGKAFSLDLFFAMAVMILPIVLPFGKVFISSAVVIFYVMLRLVMQLYLKSDTPLVDTAKSVLSFAWIVVPMLLISLLSATLESRFLILTMFIMIWLNDTGAFCFGSMLGRTKLFERISPKKTWEGFWGGFLVTAAFGWFAPRLFPGLDMGQIECMVYGALLSVVATFGDLVESMFKRALHIKDSGHILPGHGGILDRIDSLLLVAPYTCLFVLFMAYFK